MTKIRSVIFIVVVLLSLSPVIYGAKSNGDFYQIKIYHLKNNEQIKLVDQYLEKVYLPALHRLNIKSIGVFKPIANDTSSMKSIYVLIPFMSPEAWMTLEENLSKDKIYVASAKSFREAPSDNAPYDKMESILLTAFPIQMHLFLPGDKNAERVFELRSYESPTESLAEKKMSMFNTGGEVGIFKRLGFNPVFYGKVVSGTRMPNFMYMPVFDNIAQKDAQWNIFRNDPKWKEISSDPKYENKVSVSHIESISMHSTSYSDY
ncbi:MAG: NIPSNAP family protein [Ginsengibacter sp.]